MLKSTDDGLSHKWQVSKRQGATYTGGDVALVGSSHAACLCYERVAVLNIDSGIVDRFIPHQGSAEAAEPIVCFAVSPDGGKLVTFSRSLMVRLWDPHSGRCVRSWRGHRTPVAHAAFDQSGTLVASGGSDRMVMVWDTDGGFATHSFKGHTGIITAVAFQPHAVSVTRLVSASEDGGVRVWDLVSQACVAVFTEHTSAVTAIVFSPDPSAALMVTAGRDSVCCVWDTREVDLTSTHTSGRGLGGKAALTPQAVTAACLKATIPAMEAIEGAVALPDADASAVSASGPASKAARTGSATGAAGEGGGAPGGGVRGLDFVTAGEKGGLRRWRVQVTGTSRSDRKFGVGCVAVQTVTGLRRSLPGVVNAAGIPDRGTSTIAAGLGKTSSADAGDVPVSKQFERLLLRRRPGEVAHPTAATAASSSSGAGPGEGGVGAKRKREDVGTTSAAPPAAEFELLAITRDQVLTMARLSDLCATKTIVGYHDQFADVRYIPRPPGGGGGGPPLIALATNSEQVRIMDTDSLSCRLCDGHTDTVVSLSASPDGSLVASASKDNTVRVWDVATGACVAVAQGHTDTATAVAFPTKASSFLRLDSETGKQSGKTSWLASGSRDRTLKLWQLAPLLTTLPSPRPQDWGTPGNAAWAALAAQKAPYVPRTSAAVVAHEKEINSIAVSKTDHLLATASADKTVKLWTAPELGLVATLRGHKRGVWSAAFSPVEPVLASCSGDRTIRVWGVTPASGFACLRTIEGHDASVLSVRFLRKGMQLASTAADGLLKLWSPSSGECMGTFDAHGDKVWALALRPAEYNTAADAPRKGKAAGVDMEDDGGGGVEEDAVPDYELEIVTAGADSVLNVWRDVTAETADDVVAAAEEAMVKESELRSAMSARDYMGAIRLTLELEQPGRCGDILGELLESGPLPAPPSLMPGVPSQPGAMEAYNARMLAEVTEMEAEGSGRLPPTASTRAEEGLHPEGRSRAVTLLRTLPGTLLARLLTYIREWNTQSRHGLLAQRLLYLTMKHVSQARLLNAMAEAKGLAAGSDTRIVPGVGTVRITKHRDELAVEQDGRLAPLAKPTRGDGDAEGVVGVLKSAAPAPVPVQTAAVSELKAFVSAARPYTQRHAERLDRLRQATHMVSMTLDGMQALEPLDDALAGLGMGPVSGGTSKAGPVQVVHVDDERGASSSEEESQDDEARGKGWAAGSQWLRQGKGGVPSGPTALPLTGAGPKRSTQGSHTTSAGGGGRANKTGAAGARKR